MSLLLFFIVIVVSFTVVRIGAIAFELTGLEWSVATFQALSCFTGTGFTTKESELIVQNQQRRKIAKTLMIFGHAGLVTLIATFVNSLQPSQLVHKVFQPIIHLDKLPTLSVLINIIILALAFWFILALFSHQTFSQKLTKITQYFFLKKNIIKHTCIHCLQTSTDGFGIVSIEVTKQSILFQMNLSDIIRKYPVMKIIGIQREKDLITDLKEEAVILLNDRIISYGKIENIKSELH